VKRELSFMRQLFNKAINEWDDDWGGYFKNNPLNPVRKVIRGVKDVERVRYVMPEEAQRLRFTIPAWIRPVVIVGCQTGLRVGNLVNLATWEVDFHNDRINIVGEKMKNGKPFTMKITSVVKTTLMDVIRARKVVGPYIFCDAKGEPYSVRAVSMAFHRSCEKAGVKDLHFHDLRHDFATLLVNSGATLYQVQHQLGQGDPRMHSGMLISCPKT